MYVLQSVVEIAGKHQATGSSCEYYAGVSHEEVPNWNILLRNIYHYIILFAARGVHMTTCKLIGIIYYIYVSQIVLWILYHIIILCRYMR